MVFWAFLGKFSLKLWYFQLFCQIYGILTVQIWKRCFQLTTDLHFSETESLRKCLIFSKIFETEKNAEWCAKRRIQRHFISAKNTNVSWTDSEDALQISRFCFFLHETAHFIFGQWNLSSYTCPHVFSEYAPELHLSRLSNGNRKCHRPSARSERKWNTKGREAGENRPRGNYPWLNTSTHSRDIRSIVPLPQWVAQLSHTLQIVAMVHWFLVISWLKTLTLLM